ncbi:MAG: BTAD domain-containing putative transcriptional regulator [Acidobacteriota bacterium]
MSRLEIRLLGGFEARRDEQSVPGFESQKVRALLAYLLCHRGRDCPRDHLAELLWSDLSADAGRRNLRQALYNLRNTLAVDETPPLLTTNRTIVRLEHSSACWCDVETFQQAMAIGGAENAGQGAINPQQLSGAVQIYRGDFLADFFVKDCPTFDDWLLDFREQLRESVILCLRTLVDHYLRERSYDLGVRYAWRLMSLDPLSERAHRRLMKLYALSGRRNQALAQYEECARVLEEELGVEPEEATQQLRQWVMLQETMELPPAPEDRESPYPSVQLVGRDAELALLQDRWAQMPSGGIHLTLVEGESGVGKTSLLEWLLEQLRSGQRLNVLRGRSGKYSTSSTYEPLEEALRSAILSQSGYIRSALAEMSLDRLAELARMIPELREVRSDLPAAPPPDLGTLFAAISQFLDRLCRPFDEDQPRLPLILFLEDIDRAGLDTLNLLSYLVQQPLEGPLWIVATFNLDRAPAHLELGLRQLQSLYAKATHGGHVADHLHLRRLTHRDLQQISRDLTGGAPEPPLTELLEEVSGGLPLAVREVIHNLYEEGALTATADGLWRWNGTRATVQHLGSLTLEELVWRRFCRLPTSARRLLMLAAVVGPRLGLEMLASAENEHPSVVRANLRLWIERGFVRHLVDPLPELTREENGDLTATSRSVEDHSAPFEFAHERLLNILYERLRLPRRRAIHDQIAHFLAASHRDELDEYSAVIGFHTHRAGDLDRTVELLARAAHVYRRRPAPERALEHIEEALRVLDSGETPNPAQAELWQRLITDYDQLSNSESQLRALSLSARRQEEEQQIRAQPFAGS